MINRAKRLWEWFQQTLAWRAWTRFGDLRGNRLAGAVAFYAFISLFPLLVIGAAVMSAAFGTAGVETMQDIVDENLPGFGINVSAFYDNSGTIGLVGAVTLLFTGTSWVDATRAAVRSMWRMDDEPGNVVVRKLWDVAVLVGLGVLIGVSWISSAFLSRFASNVLDWFGFDGTLSHLTLRAVAFVLAVGVSMLIFGYMLSGLPRIRVPMRELLWVSLLGGAVFEILKQFLLIFVVDSAARNAYAAFATPLALLAWIYLNTRLLMVLAALMAQAAENAMGAEEEPAGELTGVMPAVQGSASGTPVPGGPVAGGQAVTVPGAAPLSPVVLSVRRARAVGFAAGGVLGLLALGSATVVRRASRAVVSAVRDDDENSQSER